MSGAPVLVAVVTRSEVEGTMFDYAAHYNMGRDGYAYGYKSQRWPRLAFIDRVYKPSRKRPDGERVREWYVDGAQVAGMDAAIAALTVRPALTEDERRVLALVPVEYADLRKFEDEIAGVEHPQGGIMPDTPHSRVLGWLEGLNAKGCIEYGRNPDRSDGKPWNDCMPEHIRWSPTIRRAPWIPDDL